MENLIKELKKDYESENFTKREWIVYGILAPLGLIAVCLIAELINAL